MKFSNVPRLRSLMKKLYAAPIEWTDPYIGATAGQEALDFIAMAAGLKPVYLTGRGFDDPRWRDALLSIARTGGFHIVFGPYWQAVSPDGSVPEWFTAPARERLAAGQACYVAKSKRVAAELCEIAGGAAVTIEREARLLGFPECCVGAHYDTATALERANFELIAKRAKGDEAMMRRLVEANEPVLPESDEERAQLAQALQVRPAPHTSLNMCQACAGDDASPGHVLAFQYSALARLLAGPKHR